LRELRDLVRTREALSASRVEWTNRRGSGQGSAVADAAMTGVINRLEAEITALEQAIGQTIGQDEDLQTKHDLLISVPGIGTHTAAMILSELPGPDVLRTARQAAAYAGLNPSHRQSDDLNGLRVRKTVIIPLFDCQLIIPSSRSARLQAAARRGGQRAAGPRADGAPCP
jgi:transposase